MSLFREMCIEIDTKWYIQCGLSWGFLGRKKIVFFQILYFVLQNWGYKWITFLHFIRETEHLININNPSSFPILYCYWIIYFSLKSMQIQ